MSNLSLKRKKDMVCFCKLSLLNDFELENKRSRETKYVLNFVLYLCRLPFYYLVYKLLQNEE